jgi:hypothetical protein
VVGGGEIEDGGPKIGSRDSMVRMVVRRLSAVDDEQMGGSKQAFYTKRNAPSMGIDGDCLVQLALAIVLP